MEGAAVAALRSVMLRVRQAAERSGRRPELVRVVAVSKTKPVSLIREAYDAGHRCFGENYVQEIVDKAPQVRSLVPLFLSLSHEHSGIISPKFPTSRDETVICESSRLVTKLS